MNAQEKQYRNLKKTEWRNRALANVEKIIDCGAVDEKEVVVRDTLCNLIHWCDEHGIAFLHELHVAEGNFASEKLGIE